MCKSCVQMMGLEIICANHDTGVQMEKRVGDSTKRQEKKLKLLGDDFDHKDDLSSFS